MKTIKTLGEWREWLTFREMEAITDYDYLDPEEELSANEVVDMIVERGGGIKNGDILRSLILRVYGIKLE